MTFKRPTARDWQSALCGRSAPSASSMPRLRRLRAPTRRLRPRRSAAAPVPNKGDTAWMLISTALVLMMSIPGLALFYGGLVRTKNMLSVLTQVFAIVSMVGVIWIALRLFARLHRRRQHERLGSAASPRPSCTGVDATSTAATFSNGVVIPEYAYFVFQMTFAMITPALIVGAFAERMKFSAVMLFILLWVPSSISRSRTWSGTGPVRTRSPMPPRPSPRRPTMRPRRRRRPSSTRSPPTAGWLASMGALDFAGGTVVHINAGIAGLVGA